jgi:thiol-disulfide isomerase/thioredoxin
MTMMFLKTHFTQHAVRSTQLLFATLAIFLATPSLARSQDSGIELGSPAPSAALETLDGKPADLARYVGKTPVVMEFWATWCPNCKELEPAMQALHKKYGAKVRFVGVAVSVNQSPERARLYVQKHAIPGDHYFDRRGNASGAYDVPATSYVVVIDRAGKVVYTGLGGKQPGLEAAVRKASQ